MAHLYAPTVLRRVRRIARQRGLTLVELMVALIVGLMVIMAAVSVFTSSSRSAGTVDAAGQLRDDARFAADIIQRLAVQTGFEDIGFVTRTYQGTPQTYKSINGLVDPTKVGGAYGMLAPISGLSGQKPSGSGSYQITGANVATSAVPGGTDTLVLRYQPVNRGSDDTHGTDGSMITCAGYAADKAHSAELRTNRAVSIFYVDKAAGDTEPTLYCRYANLEGETLEAPVPLVKGVESFRVLYGVDNVSPGAAVDANTDTEHAKLVPTRYLTAADMEVSGDPVATETNWRRVRALRVGLVLRAGGKPIQGGAEKTAQTIYPLGEAFAEGYNVDDARLRQTHIFTVNVRNCLNQGYQAAGDPGKSAAADIPPCDVIVPCGEGTDRACPSSSTNPGGGNA